MLYLVNFNVKEGRGKELQAWLKKNDGMLQKHAPRGSIYRGTYGYVLGFGPYDGAQLWELGKYGDFDAWREHEDETWGHLTEEFLEFVKDGFLVSSLLREASDVKITEAKKPKK